MIAGGGTNNLCPMLDHVTPTSPGQKFAELLRLAASTVAWVACRLDFDNRTLLENSLHQELALTVPFLFLQQFSLASWLASPVRGAWYLCRSFSICVSPLSILSVFVKFPGHSGAVLIFSLSVDDASRRRMVFMKSCTDSISLLLSDDASRRLTVSWCSHPHD